MHSVVGCLEMMMAALHLTGAKPFLNFLGQMKPNPTLFRPRSMESIASLLRNVDYAPDVSCHASSNNVKGPFHEDLLSDIVLHAIPSLHAFSHDGDRHRPPGHF